MKRHSRRSYLDCAQQELNERGTVWYMNDTSTYKARLEEEKGRLEAEMATVGRRNPANPQDWEAVAAEEPDADPSLQADKLDHFQENTAILEDLEARYADVKDALNRIDSGNYGTCEVGGEEIESDRLDADPAARTCKAHLS